MYWKIPVVVVAGLAAFVFVNRLFFPFDYGDQHLLKVEELRAAHEIGERKLTPLAALVADQRIRHVCHIGSYTRYLPKQHADFEAALRDAEVFPPVEEGPDLFAFFDAFGRLIGIAYWAPDHGEVSTASNLPNQGYMSDYRDGDRCVSVEDGTVESISTPTRFYFSIMHAPRS